MKDEKFKVIKFSKELIITLDKELENVPKKDLEIKNAIKQKSFEMLELICYANTVTDKLDRIKTLEKVIAKIKVIDFLVNCSYDKQIITAKKYAKIGLKMDDIIKYISGWLRKLQEETRV